MHSPAPPQQVVAESSVLHRSLTRRRVPGTTACPAVRAPDCLARAARRLAPTCQLPDCEGAGHPPRTIRQTRARSFVSSSVTQIPAPMCRPPPDAAVEAALGGELPGVVIDTISVVRSNRLQRVYELQLKGGRKLLLVMAPPSMMRLLRSEQHLTTTERIVILWLSDVQSQKRSQRTGRPGAVEYDKASCASGDTESLAVETIPSTGTADFNLLDYIPSLVASSSNSEPLGVPYSVLDKPRGIVIAALQSALTPLARKNIDRQAGRLVRHLSHLQPESKRFGPAFAVLSATDDNKQNRPPAPMAGGPDSSSKWYLAFHSLLESVLRDGEDMAIMLPYAAVRRNFRKLGHHLDLIITPRLVVLDAASDDNLMVEWRNKVVDEADKPDSKSPTQVPSPKAEEATKSEPQEEPDSKGLRSIDSNDPMITGISRWSTCVFGDPLMARVFCEDPSDEFLHEFHATGQDGAFQNTQMDDGLIEGKEHAAVRMLLYRCYHATAAVVREFYRPASTSSGRELAARKRLGEVLNRLEEMDGNTPKFHRRRPSGEMSPAKKLRQTPPAGTSSDSDSD
jgi:hypothetical protein